MQIICILQIMQILSINTNASKIVHLELLDAPMYLFISFAINLGILGKISRQNIVNKLKTFISMA